MEAKSLYNLEFEKILEIIASFAGSAAAKDGIRQLHPATERALIEQKLLELDELVAFIDYGGVFPIGGIRELRDILKNLYSNRPDGASESLLSGDDFLRVRANFEVALEVKKTFSNVEGFPLLSSKINAIPDFSSEKERIVQAINEQGEVRDDASPRLFAIRKELSKSRQEIERRLTDYLQTGGEIFQDRFYTIRNDRYCVPIKASYQNYVQGIVHDQSGSGQTLFIEPLEFLSLNNRIARLKSEDKEEVIRILRELTNMLCQRKNDIKILFDQLVELDILYAKTKFSRKYKASKPTLVDFGQLYLKNARHPLLYPDCVPLTVEMNSKNACIIITGPNGGGKTVALKTVGNNILLMQIGCYILADHDSKIPVFQKILADIGETQSIEDHLSTFTSHLKRINEILSEADNRSLVLIDEIGVGTDPVEGSALAIAVLKTLVQRGTLAIVTSHYDSLKQAAFQIPGFSNAAMEFDYETFKPTFRFVQGIPGKSNALLVARTFGLPEEVLSEMTAHLQNKGGEEGRLLEALERERNKVEKLRRSWEERHRKLDEKQKELADLSKKLEEFRKSRRDELIEKYEQTLKEKLKEIETIIHNFRTKLSACNSETSEDLQEARKLHRETVEIISSLDSIVEKKEEVTTQVKIPHVGDIVTWEGSSKEGIVELVDTELGRANVNFDGKILNVSIKELKIVEKANSKKSLPTGSAIGASPFIRSEIDLRGLRVEEALEKTEQYLKLASLNGLGKVRLIHGKGTGALQKAIHQYLRQSPYKDKFRFGRYGEGDLGVTVVVFDPAADVETVDPVEEMKVLQPKKKIPRRFSGKKH